MNVEFDQENKFNQTFNDKLSGSNVSKMSAFLIKKHFAKDQKQANIILVSIAIFFFVLTFVVAFNFVLPRKEKLTKEQIQNEKIIQGFRSQGLEGNALRSKILEARKSGEIK